MLLLVSDFSRMFEEEIPSLLYSVSVRSVCLNNIINRSVLWSGEAMIYRKQMSLR